MDSKFRLIPLSLSIFLAAFFLRFYGLADNHPFWVDEFSTAIQAKFILKYGLSVFTDPSIFFEKHNITTHFLVAFFFRLFGEKEWVARLPFVIIGSTVPLAVFFLTKRVFDLKAALVGALLTTFSYFEITWSRQARSYVLIQLLVLTTIYLYSKLLEEEHKPIVKLLFILTFILGILTHSLYLLLIPTLLFHYVAIDGKKITRIIINPLNIFFIAVFFIILYTVGPLKVIADSYSSGIIKANNAWYYHSFLWREYGLLIFLTVIGLIIGFINRHKEKNIWQVISLLLIYLAIHILFLSFFFAPYVSRYLLPIFPLFFILTGFTISYLSNCLLPTTDKKNQYTSYVLVIFLTLFIIGNGHKFANKPRRFFSVNHDFREIALIDYHQIYNFIKEKGDIEKGQTAIIDTWPARANWYFGLDFNPLFFYRWIDEEGLANGISKKTDYFVGENGEKIMPHTKNLVLIGELSDLKRVLDKYQKGFIFIDDASLPADIIDYAERNFKKELYLDHYPLDDNPYSIWPATLYSWGID